MTTPPGPPGRPEDHDDPTGVRALLSGLGDPGPMPADLVDRINASIAAEQQARSPHRTAAVVPLRRRLSTWPKVGLAAAAVAAVAVGIPALLGTGPGDVLASLQGGSNSADVNSAAGGTAKSAPEAVTPDAGTRLDSSAATVVLVTSGTAYTSRTLTSQARTVLGGGTMFGADSATRGPGEAMSEAGLRACLTALGVDPSTSVTGDVGTYEGLPAVVAVVVGDTGRRVYAVGPDCDAAHPAVLAGPLPLG